MAKKDQLDEIFVEKHKGIIKIPAKELYSLKKKLRESREKIDELEKNAEPDLLERLHNQEKSIASKQKEIKVLNERLDNFPQIIGICKCGEVAIFEVGIKEYICFECLIKEKNLEISKLTVIVKNIKAEVDKFV